MSTPFPLEEQAQTESAQPMADPWSGPADPHWYSGIGFGDDTAHLGPLYQLGTGLASGAEKGASLLTGLWGREYSALGATGQLLHIPGASAARDEADYLSGVAETARENAKKLTPDAATTGAAAQTLNSLASGLTRYTIGSLAGGPIGAAATVGSTEALSRYQDLREQGVDEETARASAGLAAIGGAAGAFLPGGYGSTLLQRLATGAAANVGFGMTNRYLDHKILEDGGYHAMADQQRTLDSAQLLTDTVLGMGFGGLAHLHAGAEEARVNATPAWTPTPREVPGVEDAALTANLALRDRAATPGVPVDPAAANAHSAAMEKATADLLQGNPVDVSGTGVDQADFLRRPAPDTTEPENMLVNVLKESGILDEERNLQEFEAAMGRRLSGERGAGKNPVLTREEPAVQTPAERAPEAQASEIGTREPESVTLETSPEEEGYTVGEEELTDEQRQAFERGPAADENVPADVGGGGQTGQAGRPQDDGGRRGLGSTERPTRLYRGSAVALTPEHFEPAALGHATGHPSSGLGVYFTNRRGDAARYGNVAEHDLTLRNPKRIPVEELPGFDTLAEATAYREKLRSQGHDGIVIDSSHLGGPKHYVAFDADRVTPVGETAAGDPAAQAIADHPDLQIADQDGNTASAAEALHQADTAAAQGEQDAPKATEAAINCFLRKGG